MSGRETVGDLAAAVGAISRDLSVDVTMNQVGFLPGAQKTCVLAGEGSSAFAVIRLESGEAGYRGALQASRGDLGAFRVGDFSALKDPGTYYVQTGGSRSYPFRIGHESYDPVLQMMVRYSSLQRCGPSATGYLAPCHCDDGVRLDIGVHQDVTGGWHDASDLRKWVGATLYGMIALARTLERLQPEWGTAILDEQRQLGLCRSWAAQSGADLAGRSPIGDRPEAARLDPGRQPLLCQHDGGRGTQPSAAIRQQPRVQAPHPSLARGSDERPRRHRG